MRATTVVLAILTWIAMGWTAASAEASVTRSELEAYQRALAPLVEEGRAIQQELGEVQGRMRPPGPRQPDTSDPERGFETFREINRKLARLEGLVVRAEALEPPAGLRVAFAELLLGVQHSVAAVRNLEMFGLCHQPEYLRFAVMHRQEAARLEQSYQARMREIEREVAP